MEPVLWLAKRRTPGCCTASRARGRPASSLRLRLMLRRRLVVVGRRVPSDIRWGICLAAYTPEALHANPLASLPVLRGPHDHDRDFRAGLHAAASANRSNHRHQDRYVMTTITGLRRRSIDLACRWSSTGCDCARPTAPRGHRRKPQTAASTGRRDHQSKPLPTPSRNIARAQAHRAPSHAPSTSAKSP
jgi:hypothetical protein